jgi:ABC-type multidrug transport system fused ATPase/permease subunit
VNLPISNRKISESTLSRAINVLPSGDKRKIVAVVILQICLGFLDLLGVAAIGILGALAVTGVQSQQPGNRVSSALEFLNISELTFQNQVALLGIGAASLLIVRTIISIFVTRRIFFFLSRRGALISSKLISKLLSQPLLRVQSQTSQELVYSLTAGVSAITLGVLATTVTLVADASLLLIMVVGLFVVDSLIAVTTILFFGVLVLVLYKSMNVKAQELGSLNSKYSVASTEKIVQVLDSYREAVVGNRRNYYAREIGALRLKLADVLAEMQFMPNVSKYVIESGMVIGAVVIAGAQFALQDARHAVATLSVFLAAGTRIAPAILRLQQSLIGIKSSIGSALPTLLLIESLENSSEIVLVEDRLKTSHIGFEANLQIDSVSITYPEKLVPALSHISINVPSGQSLAIVGPSGAGKTTLVDVLLGVLPPTEGSITISGKSPLQAISIWTGAMAYVPQDVKLTNGTIRENVALGYPLEVASDELVWEALKISQLETFVKTLPAGLETHVGERGAKLSGGQRQRLGVARAMFTKPKLLVLDEATSSLDGQTETEISDAIQALQGSVTVVMIAHRLSTVRNADQVIYLDNGEIIARGTFAEVRQAVPDFDKQAQLMGL